MHLQKPRTTSGSKSRRIQRKREREVGRSGVVDKEKYILSKGWSVRYFVSDLPNMLLTLVPEAGADRTNSTAEPASPMFDGRRVSCFREAGNGRLCRGRVRVEQHPRAYGGMPGSPVYAVEARRPSIREYVGESQGGPIHVPNTAAGGLSSMFRRERPSLRPGLVRTTGGCNSCRPSNARQARGRRL